MESEPQPTSLIPKPEKEPSVDYQEFLGQKSDERLSAMLVPFDTLAEHKEVAFFKDRIKGIDREQQEKAAQWLLEQPKKMQELHRLVEQEQPELMIFLDTSARPTGLLFREFEKQFKGKAPETEFAAPPDQLYQYNRSHQTNKLSSEEYQKYRDSILVALRERFNNERYDNKKIMLVDEATVTGKQVAILQKVLQKNDSHRTVQTVSLGSDRSEMELDHIWNVDFIIGQATLPPWSKHLRFVKETAKGVRKATPAEVAQGEKHVQKVKLEEQGQINILRDDLKKIAEWCVKQAQKPDASVEPVGLRRDSQESRGIYFFDINDPQQRAGFLEEQLKKVNFVIEYVKEHNLSIAKKDSYSEREKLEYYDTVEEETKRILYSLRSLHEYLQPRRKMFELMPLLTALNSYPILDLEARYKSSEIKLFKNVEIMIEKEKRLLTGKKGRARKRRNHIDK